MRRPAALLTFILLATPAAANAADWKVDPARSTLTAVIVQGGSPVTARFQRFTAKIRFDPAKPGDANAEIVVDLASFSSGSTQRDQMATAGEFLDASGHPTAIYRTTRFTPKGGDSYEVDGQLALKGITGKLSHLATIAVAGKEAHATGELKLDRLDFAVGSTQLPRGDQLGLEVTVRYDLLAVGG